MSELRADAGGDDYRSRLPGVMPHNALQPQWPNAADRARLDPACGTPAPIDKRFFVMRAACPWRLLPNDLAPWGTIYRWFAAWRDDGRFERTNQALVMVDRERVE